MTHHNLDDNTAPYNLSPNECEDNICRPVAYCVPKLLFKKYLTFVGQGGGTSHILYQLKRGVHHADCRSRTLSLTQSLDMEKSARLPNKDYDERRQKQ